MTNTPNTSCNADETYITAESIANDIYATPGDSVPSFYNSKKFEHNKMGEYLIEKMSICRIDGVLHIYDNGIYRHDESALQKEMVLMIDNLPTTQRNEVCRYVAISPSIQERQKSLPYLVPLNSCIYSIEKDCFYDYSSEHVFLTKFPYDYNPNAAPQSTVSDTIAAIANNDEDVIRLIYETIGYCFYMKNTYRKAILLYGETGRNGKSTLLNMIQQLLGQQNYSNLSLQDFSEKFRPAQLFGKAANIGDDIPSTKIVDSSIFKKVVTGENITCERKGQDPFAFLPYAKCFFAMNTLPKPTDRSKAFFDRLIIIPLTHQFDADCDVDLKDRQWTQAEMEYLMCMAIDGLKRLLANGRFTQPKSTIDILNAYQSASDPVSAFLTYYGSVEGKPTGEVYAAYLQWSNDSGIMYPMCQQVLSSHIITKTGLKSDSVRHHSNGGKPTRCFVRHN